MRAFVCLPGKLRKGKHVQSPERVHLHTSASAHAASTFTDQFSEQVLTAAPSLVVTPFHGDPSPPMRSEISDAPIKPETSKRFGTREDHNPKRRINSWLGRVECCFFLMMGWRRMQRTQELQLFLTAASPCPHTVGEECTGVGLKLGASGE